MRITEDNVKTGDLVRHSSWTSVDFLLIIKVDDAFVHTIPFYFDLEGNLMIIDEKRIWRKNHFFKPYEAPYWYKL